MRSSKLEKSFLSSNPVEVTSKIKLLGQPPVDVEDHSWGDVMLCLKLLGDPYRAYSWDLQGRPENHFEKLSFVWGAPSLRKNLLGSRCTVPSVHMRLGCRFSTAMCRWYSQLDVKRLSLAVSSPGSLSRSPHDIWIDCCGWLIALTIAKEDEEMKSKMKAYTTKSKNQRVLLADNKQEILVDCKNDDCVVYQILPTITTTITTIPLTTTWDRYNDLEYGLERKCERVARCLFNNIIHESPHPPTPLPLRKLLIASFLALVTTVATILIWLATTSTISQPHVWWLYLWSKLFKIVFYKHQLLVLLVVLFGTCIPPGGEVAAAVSMKQRGVTSYSISSLSNGELGKNVR